MSKKWGPCHYGRQVEGEAYDLTDSVATIMKGCEGLWALVKSKSLAQSTGPLIDLRLSNIRNEITKRLAPTSNGQPISVSQNDWFARNFAVAKPGFNSVNKPGYMQIKSFLPHAKITTSKSKIKKAAEDSTVHTFGWPIAVFLEGGKPEYKPVPDESGIHAEVLTDDDHYGDGNVRRTFDYWAINENGAFYLLKSIFEDDRKPGELFFNTRIVRITETLMYLKGLYSRLGVSQGEEINIEITHGGLKDRILGSSTQRRSLHWQRKCSTEKVKTDIVTTINEIETDMVSVVEKFTTPLFEQFDFFELSRDVLDDIVTNYVNGKVV